MKNVWLGVVGASSLVLGVGIGMAASAKWPGIDAVQGKPPKEAAYSALEVAEKLAGKGSWERLGVARVYYLSGDKARGQAIMDSVQAGEMKSSDWQRIGQIYADAGESPRAEQYFQNALNADPKDDTGQSEIGAWYIRIGQRDKGEALMAKAFARHPDEVWHYVRAAEAYLNIQPR